MRLIAERLRPGEWGCRAEGNPGPCAFAPLPAVALRKLCGLLGLPASSYVATERTPERIVFEQGVTEAALPCPDCRGTGRYVGLVLIEPCRACGGSGRA